MGASTSRSCFALLISAALLAGLMVVSAVAVGADEDEDESGIGMDALSGLGADVGGDTSDRAPSGDLNDPLAGGTGGTLDGSDAEASGAEPGTTGGSDQTDAATSSANPMFKLMLDLILEDVRAAEAEAKMAGKTLTEADRTAVVTGSVKDLITFLQQTGLLGEVDEREILKQIEGIPTEPEE